MENATLEISDDILNMWQYIELKISRIEPRMLLGRQRHHHG
jgi:hypothetical protein